MRSKLYYTLLWKVYAKMRSNIMRQFIRINIYLLYSLEMYIVPDLDHLSLTPHAHLYHSHTGVVY